MTINNELIIHSWLNSLLQMRCITSTTTWSNFWRNMVRSLQYVSTPVMSYLPCDFQFLSHCVFRDFSMISWTLLHLYMWFCLFRQLPCMFKMLVKSQSTKLILKSLIFPTVLRLQRYLISTSPLVVSYFYSWFYVR